MDQTILNDHNTVSLIAWMLVGLLAIIATLIGFIFNYLIRGFTSRLDQLQASLNMFIEEVEDITDTINNLEKSMTKIEIYIENLTKRVDKIEQK